MFRKAISVLNATCGRPVIRRFSHCIFILHTLYFFALRTWGMKLLGCIGTRMSGMEID